MSKRNLALIAAFLATSIYGINHTVAKEIMPIYIGSSGFIMLRLVGATSIFWIISLFTTKEKIQKNKMKLPTPTYPKQSRKTSTKKSTPSGLTVGADLYLR